METYYKDVLETMLKQDAITDTDYHFFLSLPDDKYYIVVEDRQGGDFGMYTVKSVREWLIHCFSDWEDVTENYKEELGNATEIFRTMKPEEIISWIDDMWSITMEECVRVDRGEHLTAWKTLKTGKILIDCDNNTKDCLFF